MLKMKRNKSNPHFSKENIKFSLNDSVSHKKLNNQSDIYFNLVFK